MERNKEQKSESKLMMGVTILAISGIVSKIFGAIFRIPLTNMIGAEGQSYYGAAYPVYQFFFVIATAGFPVAISRMVSARIAKGDYINAHKSFKIANTATFIISFISFVLCFFGAENIAVFMGNPEAALSIKAISIALLFTPIVASFRGYFQGEQNMTPTAVSQVGEQIVRVVVGLLLAYIYMNISLSKAAAGATFGASAGMIAAMVMLIYMYNKSKEEREANLKKSVVVYESPKQHFKELISIVIPITIGSAILPLMMIIDSMVIMRRLQATGWTLAESKVLYGLISGYCDSLVNLPVVFIDAITISLIPAVTTAFVLKNKADLDKNVKTGLKAMMLISYPTAIGLIVLGRPILYMLYPNKIEEAEMAVLTLQILSVSIITLSVMRTLSSCLQGVGKMTLPVINLGIGAGVKIIVTYVLVGIPSFNINGAAIGSTLAYLVAGLLNYRGLKKYANVDLDLKSIFIKPFIVAAVMGVSAVGVYKFVFVISSGNLISTLAAILIAVFVYFILIFKTRVVTKDEIEIIPKGDLIFRIAEKLRII
ncbi:MAG TPA: polysaccharide biosynthesis protein [Mogibacterium sp.]|nr:polysaccharide biosynthesis protein [Mogibacterium sp.]